MAKSMTGFGIGDFKDDNYNISLECRTINHKYLDINIRMPRKISYLEDQLRSLIKGYLNRGRVDVYVKFDTLKSSGTNLEYDEDLARQYYGILDRIKSDFNISQEISISEISKFPEVVKVSESEEDEDIMWNMLSIAANSSMEKLSEMRLVEGKKLESDILFRTNLLESSIKEIEKNSGAIVEEYKEKLKSRINELLEDSNLVDEARIAQEVAIYADKSNITEEIVRFKSHIHQLRDTVVGNDIIGRKMDFIIQEMNREANTIGSKSSDINITNTIIEIKSELEKIREQVQNIE
ncbi:YicC/YloC family endoribonuclease [Peptostreptococcus faecalis]|uniref:YicC/YloC family endoribonuclease n=1 Tax=Peptostreptococcus faecalis TaxID=2045015 RepID=UPI000C7A2A70|nr:YicC/YloC family endoribonuclease [Peptostreptococcus faecalis]